MAEDFTLAGYGALLDAFAERGYAARSFGDADPAARHLVLRHDLDMSLDAAVPVAEAEAARGLRAHYFVLLRTEMYNPFSAAGRDALDRLQARGHEIGLHLDASLYADDAAALDAAAARECRVLEEATGAPVRLISFHRPSRALLGLDRRLAGRPHTYQPRFFEAMGYCSDSRGAWGHGHPLDHPAVAEGRALQLLTHPIWWRDQTPDDAQAKLDRFAEGRDELLRAELARNCDIYDPGTARPRDR